MFPLSLRNETHILLTDCPTTQMVGLLGITGNVVTPVSFDGKKRGNDALPAESQRKCAEAKIVSDTLGIMTNGVVPA